VVTNALEEHNVSIFRVEVSQDADVDRFSGTVANGNGEKKRRVKGRGGQWGW
jgi:hypothetical protein